LKNDVNLKRWRFIIFLSLLIAFGLNTFRVQADEYRYDKLNRLVEVIYDSGDRVVYTYDASGNITSIDKIIASPDSIALNIKYMPLKEGEKKQLEVTAKYSDGRGDIKVNEGVIYKSDNESAARVDSTGLVEGLSKGSANIQVSYKDKTQSCSVTVVSANPSYTERILYSLLDLLNLLYNLFG
jgi:YD repeat-containing protein